MSYRELKLEALMRSAGLNFRFKVFSFDASLCSNFRATWPDARFVRDTWWPESNWTIISERPIGPRTLSENPLQYCQEGQEGWVSTHGRIHHHFDQVMLPFTSTSTSWHSAHSAMILEITEEISTRNKNGELHDMPFCIELWCGSCIVMNISWNLLQRAKA